MLKGLSNLIDDKLNSSTIALPGLWVNSLFVPKKYLFVIRYLSISNPYLSLIGRKSIMAIRSIMLIAIHIKNPS